MLPQPLPADGLAIELKVSFTGIKGVPLVALAKNNAAPLLILFEDRIAQRVIRRRERALSEIQLIDVVKTDTELLDIAYAGRVLTFSCSVASDEDLLKVLAFFRRKGVKLSERAQRRLDRN